MPSPVFFTHRSTAFEKRTSFSGDTKNKIQYYYSKFSSLFKVQFRQTHLTGITTLTVIPKPIIPNSGTSLMKHNSYAIHLAINSPDAVKLVKVASVSAKQFQSVYCTSPLAITMVYCPVTFCCCLPFHN